MRNRSTIDFLGLWEKLNNPNFKPIEFERFKNESDANAFVLSPQRWIEATNAIVRNQLKAFLNNKSIVQLDNSNSKMITGDEA